MKSPNCKHCYVEDVTKLIVTSVSAISCNRVKLNVPEYLGSFHIMQSAK